MGILSGPCNPLGAMIIPRSVGLLGFMMARPVFPGIGVLLPCRPVSGARWGVPPICNSQLLKGSHKFLGQIHMSQIEVVCVYI